ncbi:MAG: thiamine pyrophosphate-dependent enzyme [Candidatus Helarchaeota archaeon]
MTEKITIKDLPEKEYILPGTRACSGCALALAYRFALKALHSDGDEIIATVPASCSTVLHGMYPVTSATFPMLNTAFETTGASASGIKAALKALGKEEIIVLGWAGDGGTTDIGIQSLSGAAERQTDFIYACYDNEAYQNTGMQRSGSTPYKGYTTTTPAGKMQQKKNMPAIMAAHGIPYVATANPSYPIDLFAKFKKAKEFKGATRYIHIISPCPPGWGFDTKDLIKIGRLATETGMFTLYEIIDGKFQLTGVSKSIAEGKKKLTPVREYIRAQRRFRFMTDEDIAALQRLINEEYQKY